MAGSLHSQSKLWRYTAPIGEPITSGDSVHDFINPIKLQTLSRKAILAKQRECCRRALRWQFVSSNLKQRIHINLARRAAFVEPLQCGIDLVGHGPAVRGEQDAGRLAALLSGIELSQRLDLESKGLPASGGSAKPHRCIWWTLDKFLLLGRQVLEPGRIGSILRHWTERGRLKIYGFQ
jgi:hypothetical protein